MREGREAALTPSGVNHSPGKSRLLYTSGPRMASQLERAVDALISVFHNYSGKEGDKHKLSKKELKELLENELGGLLETQRDPEVVDKIMHDLDENGDGEVDFQEFVILVAALTVACNPFFSEET
ncbi:protein S100-A1 isoform X1 [Thamnophis elegans]|uniref:protein S100-A1 isoform X1 n=2 Tax=Thamnophis elegans TaxID=35005 RepID=UPI0013787370|nr:protein S100-A1 isoform X1 [Thamnophis elegans]